MTLLKYRDYYKPFEYDWAYEAYKTQQRVHWLPEEVHLNDDVKDWNNKLTDAERGLLTSIFRFFTQADCFDKDTEILTSSGWKHFKDLSEADKVAQIGPMNLLEFVKPTHIIKKPYKGTMYHFQGDKLPVDFKVTPNHQVVYEYKGDLRKEDASKVRLYQRKSLLMTGVRRNPNGAVSKLTPEERLLIAFQADGNVKKDVDGSRLGFIPHRFSFKKQRKIDRLREILIEGHFQYKETVTDTKDGLYTTFYVEYPTRMCKDFSWVDLESVDDEWSAEFIKELLHWDGHTPVEGSPSYSNTNKEAVDKVHAIACLAGVGSFVSKREDNRSEKFSDCYKVFFREDDFVDCQHVTKQEVEYDDYVYCVEVPSHKILVRRNGVPVVSGNCDVSSGYIDKYMPAIKPPEMRMMMSSFASMEAVHIDAYSLLIDTIGMPETEYQAFHEFQEMSDKHDYLWRSQKPSLNHPRQHEWENKEAQRRKEVWELALDLAKFSAFSEGLQLFSSFAILLNFKRFGKMINMGQIIAWSVRDETLHVESMVKVFRTLVEEEPWLKETDIEGAIRDIAIEMVRLEELFIDLVFSHGGVEGLTPEEVKNYVHYIANVRMKQLGYTPIWMNGQGEYLDTNPLPWVHWMTVGGEHQNFFEGRSTAYSKANLKGDWDKSFTEIAEDYTMKGIL